jgi:hypothetical protein
MHSRIGWLVMPLVLLGMAACTSSSTAGPAMRPSTGLTTSPPAGTTARPTNSHPAVATTVTLPAVPPAEPGLRTLALMPRQQGGQSVLISVVPGDVIATMLCTGGPVDMHLDPVASANIQCDTGAVSPVRNVFGVLTAQKILVRVSAGPGVEWNLRVAER